MKRIGILTYHCVINFGAQLQTLSSIGYFRNNGYEPIVLNWYPHDLEEFYRTEVPSCQYDEQFSFSQSQMPVSRLCRTVEDVAKEIQRLNIEAVFIGSDALFDYSPQKNRKHLDIKSMRFVSNGPVGATHDLPNAFWGSFNDFLPKPIPCVGFSISSQNAPYFRYNHAELNELKRLLGNFSFLSLRDDWTCNMVKFICGRQDVTVTPDPVFAFNINTSYSVLKADLLKKYKLPKNYILIRLCHDYLSCDYVNRIITQVEDATGCSCVSFPMPRKLKEYNTKYSVSLPLPTLDWYYLIKYSQGYIGELMHPIIVSLHNSVPFYCFDQYGTFKTVIPMIWHKKIPESSKIYDILKRGDFLSNVYAYNQNNIPEVKDVVNAFLHFDKDKCKKFAATMLAKYKSAMKEIEHILK